MNLKDFVGKYVCRNTLIRLWKPIHGGHEVVSGSSTRTECMEWELLEGSVEQSRYLDREVVGVTDIVTETNREAVNIVIKAEQKKEEEDKDAEKNLTVTIGGIYKHFKGKIVRVIELASSDENINSCCRWAKIFKATHTETGDDMVIYLKDGKFFYEAVEDCEPLVLYHHVDSSVNVGVLPINKDVQIWARPKSMFEGFKEKDGESIPRFTLVYPQVKED